MVDTYTKNSTAELFVVEKTMNEFGIDMIIFAKKAIRQSNERRRVLDLYTFNIEYTLVRDEDK